MMSKSKFPKNEEVWGTINTINGLKFVITYNVFTNLYYLYIKDNITNQYTKISSSKDAIKLLIVIQRYEQNRK